MENGPFIDGLPNLKMVIFHGYVIHNQRVIPTNIWDPIYDITKLVTKAFIE